MTALDRSDATSKAALAPGFQPDEPLNTESTSHQQRKQTPQPDQQQQHQHQHQRAHRTPAPLSQMQPLTPNTRQNQPRTPASPPATMLSPPLQNAASPPSKRDLKSWWKGFKLQSRNHDAQEQLPRGIFGVPLRQSITYANVAISLIDEHGKSYIYGYVPIVVAKCGVYLKDKATEVEGIFRLSGSEKRIKELKLAFDSPDRYGKGLSWAGYTVHDAANVLRRYLNDLPEPVVPLNFYDRFREPLRHAIKQGSGDVDGPQFVDDFDMGAAIAQYQNLITELPPLNRQLLLYILDLLAVFAAKADVNRMNSQNLSAIFQPGILSHPTHAMAPEEYRLNQFVLIFLIENQDHFLIGMRGTAADEQTVQEVLRGTPPVTPNVWSDGAGAIGVSRTASNASAGAESVARDGKIRRNRSTSSRNSRHSGQYHHTGSMPASAGHSANKSLSSSANNHVGHASSPRSSSPAIVTTPTASGNSSGLSRSNTLPARSPGIGPGRFSKRSDLSGSHVSPLTPSNPHITTQVTPSFDPVDEVATPVEDVHASDPFTAMPEVGAPAASAPAPAPTPARKPKFTLGGLPPAIPAAALGAPQGPEVAMTTPSKEKRFQLFPRSNTSDSTGEQRPQPNKLKKKRLLSGAHESAHSSTASLPTSPAHELAINPMDEQIKPVPNESAAVSAPDSLLEATPRASQAPSTDTTATATPTQSAVANGATSGATSGSPPRTASQWPKRASASTSPSSSFNEGSDMDTAAPAPLRETSTEPAEKAKKRLWRLSRRRDDAQSPQPAAPAPAAAPAAAAATAVSPLSNSNLSTIPTTPGPGSSLGSNAHAGVSTSSVGSGGPSLAGVGSLTLTGASASSDPALAHLEAAPDSGKSGDETGKGKISGWLKNKYREAKETAEQRRTKSPSPSPPVQSFASASTLSVAARGKSCELDRVAEESEASRP
ncbi:GTPase activating protein (GAP) for Rho1p [Sporothrix epigloea]|uniref:GTPase activating protein (GAP) for Rho1p n=1 Tax=Sporothrix epigloea TaxID=1892477 RepID=A0ABP0E1I7_9PEZI